MKNNYTINNIRLIPMVDFQNSIIQFEVINLKNNFLSLRDEASIQDLLLKYNIKHVKDGIYDYRHLIGFKCEVEFDDNFQIKLFNYCYNEKK